MSRTERIRPTGAAALIGAVIAAVALAGCGAGQITQTSGQVAAVGGANSGEGTIVLRDAQIEFSPDVEGAAIWPRGGSAPLQVRIVNQGTDADLLVSASSPVAASVAISGVAEIPAGRVLLVEGAPAIEPAAAPPAAPVPGATAVPGAAEPSAAPTTTSAPTSAAPTGSASGERTAQVVLTGLREDIQAGLTYPVVLVFERAGEIRLDVPVGYPNEERAEGAG